MSSAIEESVKRQMSQHLHVSVSQLNLIGSSGRGGVYSVAGRWIAKIYPTGSKKPLQVASALNLLGEAEEQVRTPRLVEEFTLDGSFNTVLLFEYVRGTEAPVYWADDHECREKVIDQLRRLHSVNGSSFSDALVGEECFATWEGFLLSRIGLMAQRFERKTNEPAPHSYLAAIERFQEEIAEASRDLADVQPSLVHRDVYSANLLMGEDTEIWLLDFDLAAWMDPVMDLVKPALLGAGSSRSVLTLAKRFELAHFMTSEGLDLRFRVCERLELLWGYPALVALHSSAARDWWERIEAFA